MITALQKHWPEYLIEAWALGTFMISAIGFTALIEHPASPIHPLVANAFLRRALIGLAMGLTAIALIYSPWGQRSGAHMNPATTLTFLHLRKINPCDAAFYVGAQFVGGVCGVFIAKLFLGQILEHSSVQYVATVPGAAGAGVAFLAEIVIACGMMLMVLFVTNAPRLASYTGMFAGLLVFLYITFEAPLSGMSMNPARTAASAIPSGIWTHSWIYFAAPLLGMLAAAQIFLFAHATGSKACPKLHHGHRQRCIFCGQTGVQPHAAAASAAPTMRSPASM
ncbi:MAG: aquaporin [Verrucomicrobiota bacterium]